MDPVPKVAFYTDCDIVMLSYVTTGLSDLANQGRIQLQFRLPRNLLSRRTGLFVSQIHITDAASGRSARVCVDAHDVGDYFCYESLQDCDLYFKRSYNSQVVENLPPELRQKLRPLGVCFGCVSSRERSVQMRQLGSFVSRIRRLGFFRTLTSPSGWRKIHSALMRRPARYRSLRVMEDAGPGADQEAVHPRIYFNTRLWQDDGSPSVDQMNQGRIELVRALKNRFRDRFLGGIIPGSHDAGDWSDCVTNTRSDMESHLQNMRSSLVCIYTNGLHGSVAWKLGEYLASGKCIVAEPFQNEITPPLVDGRDLFYFRSVEECVDRCEFLLDDPERSAAMRNSASEYYRNYVKPSAAMWRVVASTLDCPANGVAGDAPLAAGKM